MIGGAIVVLAVALFIFIGVMAVQERNYNGLAILALVTFGPLLIGGPVVFAWHWFVGLPYYMVLYLVLRWMLVRTGRTED